MLLLLNEAVKLAADNAPEPVSIIIWYPVPSLLEIVKTFPLFSFEAVVKNNPPSTVFFCSRPVLANALSFCL